MSVTLALAELVVSPVLAAPPATEGPALPSVEDEPGEDPLPDLAPSESEPEPEPEPGGSGQEQTEPAALDTPSKEPSAVVEPPAPNLEAPKVVRVAVGLSGELDGSKDERALLDRLEASVAASPRPPSDVRRLRVGSSEPPKICREGRDDLVISIGYLPDRSEPVLFTRDCRIDENLGVRSSAAAADPDLLGVLWAEHDERIANGARERRRARISPKVRTGLIASAAVAVIGVAVGLLIAGAVRRDTVVLVVSP
ncbi:hypothetical protein ENSA5_37990 [Enhygromyxa salina]|uniref:Uncharacterized protein n=1 Tax=Enhygromyxa salina TaxID=215803 RepID=A0A2S9XS44_9BACT|nr:hypothetical protein [Enhygromyxa salina]PRP95666.1 hypothetical protein ENSA5_37990 [Enhygromyxa salina]